MATKRQTRQQRAESVTLYYSKERDGWVRQPTADDAIGIAVRLEWSETLQRYVTIPR